MLSVGLLLSSAPHCLISRMEIAQIVPRLPPAVGGLADFALLIAKQLRVDHNIDSRFIVGDPGWRGLNDIDGFLVRAVTNRTTRGLFQALGNVSPVLLHYVGYGYAKRGCPFWLIDGLERWRTKP